MINRFEHEDINGTERAEIQVRLGGEQMRRLAMENFSSQNVPKAVSAKTRKARVQIEKEMLTKAKHNSIEYLEHDMDMIESLS